MTTKVLTNGTLVTAAERSAAAVVVEDGRIAAIHADASTANADGVVDATGRHVLPGLVHPHCHFRDPGLTYKETSTRASAPPRRNGDGGRRRPRGESVR